jgi:hypothetical protein
MAVDFSIKKKIGNGLMEQPAATDEFDGRIWWPADKTAII